MKLSVDQTLRASLAASVICLAGSAGAQIRVFDDRLEETNSNWSNPGNWQGMEVADSSIERADIISGDPVVDSDFTVSELRITFGNTGSLLSGPGTLTIDRNISTPTLALVNGSGGDGVGGGAVFEIDGNIAINNSNATPGRTVARNNNNTANVIRFSESSVLTLQTGLELQVGSPTVRGAYEFNGSLAGPADLFFNQTLATFGATADNAGYEGDLVFFRDAETVSNVIGGTLVKSGSKVQVNGNNSRIEINGPETFLGSVVVGAANTFTLDVNANQSSMELLEIADGQLTLDIDAAVTELAFANSSAVVWGTGLVSIAGFKEDTIRFGTDATGLTPAQLAAIDGGIYSLSSQGYLTTMSTPSLLGDYNEDGLVDAADYTVWRDAENGNVALPNDNGLGTPIGSSHYDLWAGNYGNSLAPAASIPEPGALLLTLSAVGVLCRGKRRMPRTTPLDTHRSGVGVAF
jgi:hypothetical protein